MSSVLKKTVLGLVAIATTTQVVALPTVDVVPVNIASLLEIIPGPRLPSLASLNLTSAELYAKLAPEFLALSARELEKRSDCYGGSQCTLSEAVGCYNFLNALGTTGCGGSGLFLMCQSGPCHINGFTVNLVPSVNSFCQDVAFAVSAIAFNCPHDGDHAGAGKDRAFGNGDFGVELVRFPEA